MKRLIKFILILIILLLLLFGVFFIINKIKLKKMGSTERMSYSDYFPTTEGELFTIYNQNAALDPVISQDGVAYLPFSMVTQKNKRFLYEESENAWLFTTGTKVFLLTPNKNEYRCNDKKESIDTPILIEKEDKLYARLDFVSPYIDLYVKQVSDPNLVILFDQWGECLCFRVLMDTPMRTEPTKDSPILLDLTVGEELFLYDGGGVQENGYLCLMTEEGIFGYVRTKDLSEGYYVACQSSYEEPVYTTVQKEHSINLSWHLTVSSKGNDQLESLFADTEGMTVISPTWFNVMDETGRLESRADLSYVERAHELGLEVWGLFSNSHPDLNYLTEIDEMELLQTYASRSCLISQILFYAKEYKLDGVNIDFEDLDVSVGPYYVQFLRELSVACRNQNLVLSVDNYVPANYNAFYDLEEQGRFVDYVVIMAYDEHYVGSEPGSVASLSFVEQATKNTLSMVDASHIIMAVPFYSRLWTETPKEDGSVAVVSQTVGIAQTNELLGDHMGASIWDEETGQNYCEYEKNQSKYRIWIEDETSIEEKMRVIGAAKLGGVASWRLGLERRSIWKVIGNYLH